VTSRVRFVDGPPPIGGPDDPRTKYVEPLQRLIARPGQWAEIASGPYGAINALASALRARQYWVPPGGWNFSMRGHRRGTGTITGDKFARATLYARYLGPEDHTGDPYRPYRVVGDALFDQWGQRLCPECETNALINNGGKYPSMCDPCGEAMAATIDAPHGDAMTYLKKRCRCRLCREAGTERNRENGRRRDARVKAEKIANRVTRYMGGAS
jgi:hypothetical protein